MYKSIVIFQIYIICLTFYVGYAQTVKDSGNVTEDSSPTIPPMNNTTVKPDPNISCETHNNDCKACVENSQCYYCTENNRCFFHIQRFVAEGDCSMTSAYFLTCKANLKTMLIIIGVLSGITILIILIVCCYCCCKKKGVKISKDDLKWARQREERKQIAAERRKERAERTEEIRKKYGLVKDANPYQRFDA